MPTTKSPLAAEQKAWADAHVGEPTTVNLVGTVVGYDATARADEGLVVFTVEADDGTVATFLGRPPLTAAQVAEQEAAAEEARVKTEEEQAELAAETERLAQEADAERAAAEEARIAELVDARIAELGLIPHTATTAATATAATRVTDKTKG